MRHEHCKPKCDVCGFAVDEPSSDQKDAARYRWLREPQNADQAAYAASLWGRHMDEAIDLAMDNEK
jgi:hypothetical protein